MDEHIEDKTKRTVFPAGITFECEPVSREEYMAGYDEYRARCSGGQPEQERPLHAGDLWQASAKYCIEFIEEGVIYEPKMLDSVVALVGILLKG